MKTIKQVVKRKVQRHIIFMDWKTQYGKILILPKLICRFKCNSYQLPTGFFFCHNRQAYSKTYIKS